MYVGVSVMVWRVDVQVVGVSVRVVVVYLFQGEEDWNQRRELLFVRLLREQWLL